LVFKYQIQKPEQNNTSAVAPAATLNAPALSTVFEIYRPSVHCCYLTVATLIQWPGCRLEQRGKSFDVRQGQEAFILSKAWK